MKHLVTGLTKYCVKHSRDVSFAFPPHDCEWYYRNMHPVWSQKCMSPHFWDISVFGLNTYQRFCVWKDVERFLDWLAQSIVHEWLPTALARYFLFDVHALTCAVHWVVSCDGYRLVKAHVCWHQSSNTQDWLGLTLVLCCRNFIT